MLLALTLVFGVFVFSGSASATHDEGLLDYQSAVDEMLAVDPTLDPPPNDQAQDFAVGGFQGFAFGQKVGFSAHMDGPMAEEAWGQVTQTVVETGEKVRWRVVCLADFGSRASMGIVEQGENPEGFIDEGFFIVRDSRLPGGTGDSYRFEAGHPRLCELELSEPLFLIQRGNILVHDAQP